MDSVAQVYDSMERAESGRRWYVFYTRIASERVAQRSISNLGYEVFIPFEKRMMRLPRAKPRVYETPLFGRYGFTRFDVNKDEWGAIKDCFGVVDILRWNNLPRAVSDSVIDGLKLSEHIGVFDRTKPPAAGMSVLITQGPCADFIGRVLRARPRDRVDVLLTFLGGEIEATIPIKYLREINR